MALILFLLPRRQLVDCINYRMDIVVISNVLFRDCCASRLSIKIAYMLSILIRHILSEGAIII